jgi:uncharacterized phage protein (TIGR01671 family)
MKIRIWDRKIKDFTSIVDLLLEHNPSEKYRQDSEFVFLASTGVQDKEDNEIYEGDICRYDLDYFESQGGQIEPDVLPIIFKDGCFWFGDTTLNEYTDGSLTIIGNIFHNPEYLTKTELKQLNIQHLEWFKNG